MDLWNGRGEILTRQKFGLCRRHEYQLYGDAIPSVTVIPHLACMSQKCMYLQYRKRWVFVFKTSGQGLRKGHSSVGLQFVWNQQTCNVKKVARTARCHAITNRVANSQQVKVDQKSRKETFLIDRLPVIQIFPPRFTAMSRSELRCRKFITNDSAGLQRTYSGLTCIRIGFRTFNERPGVLPKWSWIKSD